MKKSIYIIIVVFSILLFLGISTAVIWNRSPSANGLLSPFSQFSKSTLSSDIEIDVHSIAFCQNPKDIFPSEPYFKYRNFSPSDGNTFVVVTYSMKNNGKHSQDIILDCGTIIYSDGYEYSANTFSGISEVIEKGNDVSSYFATLAPLCDAEYYAILEVPKFVEDNSEESLQYSIGGIAYRVR